MAVKSVSVLGSTGSVGTQTLELLTANREHYRVVALVAGRNARLLAAQALALRAEIAVINDPAGYAELRAALAGSGIEAACGPQAVVEAAATPEIALRHPVWSMGAKISIDSATMMNKGLEVIEAARLFNLPSAQIGVLIHPQSVVHGLVYYADGSVLAQLGSPDMRVPIAHTLAWPTRIATAAPKLDLAAVGRLEFSEPDLDQFPALRWSREALQAGGGAPTILSAANEVAVEAFLQRQIGFLDIVGVVADVVETMGPRMAEDLDQVIGLDAEARRRAVTACDGRAKSRA